MGKDDSLQKYIEYKLILPSFKNTARQINSRVDLTVLYYINTPSLLETVATRK